MNNIAICLRCRQSRKSPGCNGPCPCPVDGIEIRQHANRGDCPIGLHAEGAAVPEPAAQTEPWGPRLWKLWHVASADPAMLDGAEAWIEKHVVAETPCGECRRELRSMLDRSPPDTSTSDAYFASVVGYHNAVNRRLGKPEFTVAEARAAWISTRA